MENGVDETSTSTLSFCYDLFLESCQELKDQPPYHKWNKILDDFCKSIIGNDGMKNFRKGQNTNTKIAIPDTALSIIRGDTAVTSNANRGEKRQW